MRMPKKRCNPVPFVVTPVQARVHDPEQHQDMDSCFRRNDSRGQRGNVLVMLLVAIALIAALTAALTRSDVFDTDSIAPEQAKILGSRVLAQARALEQATKTLIDRGCSEQQLSFENAVIAGYANADAPADDSCDIFEPEGAGLSFPAEVANANDGSAWRLMAGNAVGGLTQTDDGTCASGCIDLMAVLPNVTLAVCKQLNALAGVTVATASPPIDLANFDGTTKIAGFDATAAGEALLDAGNILSGRATGCFEATNISGASATGTYWFYHVVMVR